MPPRSRISPGGLVRLARLVAACLALTVALPALPAGADTASTLHGTRARLAELEHQIQSATDLLGSAQATLADGSRRLDRLQSDLGAVSSRIAKQEARFAAAEQRVMAVRDSLGIARSRMRGLRSRLDQHARDAYMAGAVAEFDVLLSSSSMGDLADRAEFLGLVSRHESDLASGARTRGLALADSQHELERVLAARATAMRRLQGQRSRLAGRFAAQQAVFESQRAALQDRQNLVADLDTRRAEVMSLVDSLKNRLASEERARALEAARQAAAAAASAGSGSRYDGTMPISYTKWASLLLPKLSAPVCRSNLVAVVAWEASEYTKAQWNPLATTQSMPGASAFNSVGVRNYASLDQGLDATVLTLNGPASRGYGAILASLRACADAMNTAYAINASAWCRGCAGGAYVIAVVPAVEAFFSQQRP
jgi:peptidoglycan hydrolase CwlO-like protein